MRLEYFQLIDRIVELDLDARTIRAQSEGPQASTIFEGHFPGFPLMPGVLLAEAMAQTCGWLVIAANGFERMPFLAAINQAKFRTFVTPRQILDLSGRLVHEGSGYARAEASVAIEGRTVSDAELTFRVMPFPDPKFRTEMAAVARRIGLPGEVPVDG